MYDDSHSMERTQKSSPTHASSAVRIDWFPIDCLVDFDKALAVYLPVFGIPLRSKGGGGKRRIGPDRTFGDGGMRVLN